MLEFTKTVLIIESMVRKYGFLFRFLKRPRFLKNAISSFKGIDMLRSINLSLSLICNADCIYCPSNRGKRSEQKMMPFDYVEKIINETLSKNLKKYHDIKKIEIGENGEAFLNNDLIKILRFIKSKLPYIKVSVSTNFSNLTKDKAEIILGEELIDDFRCNIDGSANSNYFNVKRLELQNIRYNLINFLEIRKRLNSDAPITIQILTLHDYIYTIYNNFGFYPLKLRDHNLINVPDDFLLVKEEYEKMLNPEKDKIIKPIIFGWAERQKIDTKKVDYNKYSCPNLDRIKKEAFIAPDGTWYACCFDSNNELVLGNVIKKSIKEIFFGEKRRELIELLEDKQFTKIGGPCKTVNCCQPLSKNTF